MAETTSFIKHESQREGYFCNRHRERLRSLVFCRDALNSVPAMSGRLEKKNPTIKDVLFVFSICDPRNLFSKPRFSELAHSSRSAVEKS